MVRVEEVLRARVPRLGYLMRWAVVFEAPRRFRCSLTSRRQHSEHPIVAGSVNAVGVLENSQ
jgi:flavin reductase (DIM6/NTAB) family NADH-FMN oxidoreductase RutF